MADQRQDHVDAGWNEDAGLRWIEAGRLRLEEDDQGAIATVLDPQRVHGVWQGELSATELVGLVRHLAGWFADDPTETIRQIEVLATRVQDELEAWNIRARADEEHPPYDDLTRALGALLGNCRELREVIGKFAGPRPVITVEESAE